MLGFKHFSRRGNVCAILAALACVAVGVLVQLL